MENKDAYSIEINTNPQTQDNKEKPYFWSIWEIDNETDIRIESGKCGWSKNISEAWNDAYHTFNKYIKTK